MKIIETNLPHPHGFTRRSKTDMVVVHHAAARSARVETINQWHNGNGWNGIGYHYYVRKDGGIYRGRPEWALGSHAQGSNDRSIGICCEGDYMVETMPAAQLASVKALLRDIMGRYGKLALRRHKDVCSTDCPGDKFPWTAVQDYDKEPVGLYPNSPAVPGPKESEDGMTEKQVRDLAKDEIGKARERYDSIDECPAWARETVRKLVDKGIIQGEEEGRLGLTYDLMRLLVINDRAGLYK